MSFSKELKLLVMLPHLSVVSEASDCPSAIFREAWGWILIGRRTPRLVCWCRDTQYIAANKKIRMTTETNIRLNPQLDFTAAVMMGGHAGRTCFAGTDSCNAPWLPLHWQCVLVKLHPIWNLVILMVSCRKKGYKPNYVEVESSQSQIV